jgi:sugar phosphate isomerase/epimerase
VKLALRENMAPGGRLEERLAFLERIGYDGIELTNLETVSRDPAELASVFRDHPVRPTTIEGVRKLLDPDPAERRASLDLLRARLELAARLDAIGVLVVPIFGRALFPDLSPYQTATQLETGVLLAELNEIAVDAERIGSRVLLEPLNRYETHLVNTLEQGAELCRRVNRPAIRIMADFFHMSIEEADIAESIRLAAPFVRYIHVADSNRKQPGRGHLDFRPGFRSLKAAGYDGYLGVECGLIGDADAALREAASYLREVWAEA